MATASGSTLARYTFRRRIGSGASGEVWEAVDGFVGRKVAVKVVGRSITSDPKAMERFIREVHLVNRLEHPRILQALDVWAEGDEAYLVMPLLAGGSLKSRLEVRHPPSAAVWWISDLASALDHAHERGVIHRDVKPANVLFDVAGRLFLADFGIAKDTTGEAPDLTTVGAVLGTPQYMSPEQLRGERLTPASDQYALGVIAYRLLTGALPFGGESMVVFLSQTLNGSPRPPREVEPRLPEGIDAVLLRALARDPAQRFPSCRAFAEAVAALFAAPAADEPEDDPVTEVVSRPKVPPARQAPRRPGGASRQVPVPASAPAKQPASRGRLVALAAVAVVVVAALAGFALRSRARAAQSPRSATPPVSATPAPSSSSRPAEERRTPRASIAAAAMSRSWIPGFVVAEGPEKTGITLRFRGFREKDGVPVWIRLDGFPPNELRSALAVAKVYQETARLDHPDLPPVLGYGSTEIAGRPFIAFQLAPELMDRRPVGAEGLDEAVETLAEIQLAAHEIGAAGVHVPYFELERIREGVQLEGRRLPIREYLAEPRRADGLSAFTGAVEEGEWQPFTAPETRAALRHHHRPSVRQALSFRLASQVHFLVTGTVAAVDRPAGAFHPAPPNAASAAVNPLAGLLSDARRLATGAALGHNPNRRPPVETFLS